MVGAACSRSGCGCPASGEGVERVEVFVGVRACAKPQGRPPERAPRGDRGRHPRLLLRRLDRLEEAPPHDQAVDRDERRAHLAPGTERCAEVVPQPCRDLMAPHEHVDPEREDGLRLEPVSYTHLRAHETDSYLVCRLLLEKKKQKEHYKIKKTL